MERSPELCLEVVSEPHPGLKSLPVADRSGLKAERTDRGWKATPTSEEQNWVVASYIADIARGSGF